MSLEFGARIFKNTKVSRKKRRLKFTTVVHIHHSLISCILACLCTVKDTHHERFCFIAIWLRWKCVFRWTQFYDTFPVFLATDAKKLAHFIATHHPFRLLSPHRHRHIHHITYWIGGRKKKKKRETKKRSVHTFRVSPLGSCTLTPHKKQRKSIRPF